MSFIDEMTKGKALTGLAIGVGAAILLPRLLPALAEAAKPLVKGVMKSGLLCFEKSKEVIAELSETTEDLWAEVKTEMEESHQAAVEEVAIIKEDPSATAS